MYMGHIGYCTDVLWTHSYQSYCPFYRWKVQEGGDVPTVVLIVRYRDVLVYLLYVH